MGPERLSRYLPAVLRQHAAALGHEAGYSWPLHGSILFSDIAGFTALTERYAAQGAEGAEALARALDIYFGGMAQVAADHGGDVIDFIGDALVVLWPVAAPDKDHLRRACEQAASCGLAMNRHLAEISGAIGASLEQRIAISAGSLEAHRISGPAQRQCFVVTGRPIQEAAEANAAAGAGEVVLAGACADLGGEGWSLDQARNGHLIVRQLSRPMDELRAWEGWEAGLAAGPAAPTPFARFLPSALARHAEAAGDERLAEFRNVSTVFVRFDDIAASAAGCSPVLQAAVTTVLGALQRFGGSFERLSCDEKGITVLAAFGLPYQSHEDDGARAVLAAREIQDSLRTAGQAASLGVTRGRIFYADTGGATRRHLCMVGDPVNLAARLMTADQGLLLCDQPTRHAAQAQLLFDEGSELEIRGRTEACRVFRPLAPRERHPRAFSDEMADRVEERALLHRRLTQQLDGSGSVTLLVGEAGVGKSRLIADCVQHARALGIRVLSCAGHGIESFNPYYPWKSLLGELLSPGAPTDMPAARATVERLVGQRGRLLSWLPLLADVLPLGYEETALTREMTGQARAAGLQGLLLHLMRQGLEGRSSLIIVDDLHWFDEASAHLLDQLLGAQAGLRAMFLIGSRPAEQAQARAAELLKKHRLDALRLDVMPADFMDEFVRIKLGVSQLPPTLVSFVLERTGGHALYSEELLHALRDSALLRIEGNRCEVVPELRTQSLEVLPDSMEGIIVSRLDALDGASQHLLKIASVIGRDFALNSLAGIVKEDIAVLAGAARAAVAGGFLIATAEEQAYSFRHAILQDVVYSLLPYAQRRQLHRQVAETIAGQPTDVGAQAAVLARHWELAGENGRAVEQLEVAAERALTRYANREAIAHLEHAYRLLGEEDSEQFQAREARWHRLLGDAHAELFDTDAAVLHYMRALDCTEWPVPATRPGLLVGLLGQAGIQLIRRLGFAPRQAAAGSDLSVKLAFAALVHSQTQRARIYQTQILAGLYHLFVALNLAERSGARNALVWAHAAMGVVLSGLSRPRSWARYYDLKARRLALESGALDLIGHANIHSALVSINRADWAALESQCDAAGEAFAALGADLRWVMGRIPLATARVLRGHFEEARPDLEACKAAMPEQGTSPFVRSWPYAAEVTIGLSCKTPCREAEAQLEDACADERMPSMDRLRCLGLLALSRWRREDRSGALRLADQAWALVGRGGLLGYWIGDGVAALVEVFLEERASYPAQARSHPAGRRARQVCREFARYAAMTPVHLPRALILRGRCRLLDGRPAATRRLLRRGLEEARRRQMPLDEALALQQLSLLNGAEASDCRLGAEAIFRRLGAEYYLELMAADPAPVPRPAR